MLNMYLDNCNFNLRKNERKKRMRIMKWRDKKMDVHFRG